MRYFCCYFDERYLPRAIAMYRSLERHCPDFKLFALCLSDVCYDALCRAGLPRVAPIRLPDLERFDPALAAARVRRSLVEYYFTLTPVLPLLILAAEPAIDLITYVDSDLLFFDDPEPLFDELGDGSVLIIGHRFSERNEHRTQYGRYNVGWVTWRNDREGRACLSSYRQQCLAWCYAFLEGGRFADQRYLDAWPERYGRLVVSRHKGCNLAPWNIDTHRLSVSHGRVDVGGDPLVFYHYHALRSLTELSLATTGIEDYAPNPASLDGGVILESIYLPYLLALESARAETAALTIEAVERPGERTLWRSGLGWSHQVSDDRMWGRPTEIDPHRGLAARAIAALPVRPGAPMLEGDGLRELILDGVLRDLGDEIEGRLLNILDWTGAHDGYPALRLAQARLGARLGRYALLDSPVPPADLMAAFPGATLARTLADGLRDAPDLVVTGFGLSETADWFATLGRLRRSGASRIVLDLCTTTDRSGAQARRRAPGSATARPIWIHKRQDLVQAFHRFDLDVVAEYVWSESFELSGIVERVDHRTVVLKGAAAEEGTDP